jgi:hypothetical protein
MPFAKQATKKVIESKVRGSKLPRRRLLVVQSVSMVSCLEFFDIVV